ncbi:hypothetical protein B0H17DRAFT_1183887, partial [Mycena rosella]
MAPTQSGHRSLRSNPSLTSLTSLASSLPSLYTTTSSATQWGPGALAGKAILALGKATLRGAENVVILRRMVTIRAHLPCLDEERSGANACFMDGIFEDLAELSRPELYSENIRYPAMELILKQIALMRTAYFIHCLSKWSLDDLIALISEVMSICILCDRGFREHRLAAAYASALPPGHHPLDPCLSFISELVRQNRTTFEAAVLSKFPELVLLSSCGRHRHTVAEPDEEERLDFTCASAFTILSTPDPQLHEIWRTSLDQYWPFYRPPSLRDVVGHISTVSPDTWLVLEAHFLQQELDHFLELAMPGKFPSFSGGSAYTTSLGNRAIKFSEILDAGNISSWHALGYLIRCVVLGGDITGILLEHIHRRSHRSRVSLFSRIIFFLLPNTSVIQSNPSTM